MQAQRCRVKCQVHERMVSSGGAAAAAVAGKAGAVSGAETEAEGDATDVDPAAAAAGEGDGVADLPAELSALVLAATTDQSELPDLFGDPQLFGTSRKLAPWAPSIHTCHWCRRRWLSSAGHVAVPSAQPFCS